MHISFDTPRAYNCPELVHPLENPLTTQSPVQFKPVFIETEYSAEIIPTQSVEPAQT